MYKNRFFVKSFVIIFIDGYIVDVMGFYLFNGKNNDVFIIKYIIMLNFGNIMEFFKDDDVLIVDCGFRDVIFFLNELGFKIYMFVFF